MCNMLARLQDVEDLCVLQNGGQSAAAAASAAAQAIGTAVATAYAKVTVQLDVGGLPLFLVLIAGDGKCERSHLKTALDVLMDLM